MPIHAVVFSKRRADLSPEQFRKQYDEHIDFSLGYFGHLWLSYKRAFLGPANYLSGKDTPHDAAPAAPYDAVAELVLADNAFEEQAKILANDPHFAQALDEDEMRTFDRDATFITFCDVVVTEDLPRKKS